MKLRIGDKVRFLNETGEGIITRFKDKESAFVEMNDGFEIPYPVKELVPIHTELILNTEADNMDVLPESSIADTIYFIIEPDHEMPLLANDYAIYLFNSSSYNLQFAYSIKDDAYFQSLKHGEIGAFQKILLKQVKLNFFKEYPYQKIECILFKNTHYRAQLPIAETIYVNSENLNEWQLIRHAEFKRPVYAFILKEEFIEVQNVDQHLSEFDLQRLKSVKEFKSSVKSSKSHKEQMKKLEKEVDLHIEELVDSISGLSSHEMLSIQLEKVDKEIDLAFNSGTKKLILIHGVGNGRLKMEIHKILKSHSGLTFQDASYKIYGYGATQVNFF